MQARAAGLRLDGECRRSDDPRPQSRPQVIRDHHQEDDHDEHHRGLPVVEQPDAGEQMEADAAGAPPTRSRENRWVSP